MLASTLCAAQAQKSGAASAEILRQWYATSAGRRTLEREQHLISQHLVDAPGGYALWYCTGGRLEFPKQLRKVIQLHPHHKKGLAEGLICAPPALPFAAESVDLILLHHVVDFADSLDAVLLDSLRVLKKRGHLILIGFNGHGVLGAALAWQRLRRRRAQSLVSAATLCRRLRSYGCGIHKVCYRCGPPGRPKLLAKSVERLAMLYAYVHSNIFLVYAVKQSRPLTPIRMPQRSRRRGWRPHPQAAAPRTDGAAFRRPPRQPTKAGASRGRRRPAAGPSNG